MLDDNDKTVDIDTSGPEVEVNIPEEKDETVVEQKEEKVEQAQPETPEVKPEVQETKPVEEKKEEKEPEDEKEKELEQYSDSVQKRIAKLTKKWREAERQKDEAVQYAQTVIKAKQEVDQKISKLEPSYLQTTEDGIKAGLEAAKAKLGAAREANDLQAETEAVSAISELGYKQAKFLETKTAQEEFNKNKQKEVQDPATTLGRKLTKQGTPDPKAESWADKNNWFGNDNAMTYTAFDIHKQLTEEEGFDPTSDEYYSEVDKRIRLEFPHKFDKNVDRDLKTTKPVQTVASAKRSTNQGRKTVRLTPSQVAISRKIGVPLEEYAKQLKITKEA
jgi:hypothetical protein